MKNNLFVPFFEKSASVIFGTKGSSKNHMDKSKINNIGTIHFIGIGGIGMSGIAELFINLGYRVSGSDLKKSQNTQRLEGLGATIFYEHTKENVENCSVVVFSAAVPMTNPEIREAKRRKIPVIPRAEMLNELVRIKKGIGISGTHGKTTTTGMMSFILKEADMDPTMLIGGVLNSMGSNAHLGTGEYLIFEACEAYGSIDYFLPEISVLLNIDKDHMECYNSFDDLKSTFLKFVNKVPFYSFSVVNIDDENIASLISSINKRIITFGFSEDADVRAYDIQLNGMSTSFKVKAFNEEIGDFKLEIPGKHNVLNALSAIATSLEIGVEVDAIRTALQKFRNSDRRFQVLYNDNNVTVIDDYAHHPKELLATLSAAKQFMHGANRERVIAVFQPHLFSRTKMFYGEFAESLKIADKIFLTDIYPAREKPIPGVTSSLISDLLVEDSDVDVEYIKELSDLPNAILEEIKEGDIVILLGAGDITKAAHQISEALSR